MRRSKNQKHWSRYRLPDDVADILSVIMAIRRIKRKDAFIVIAEALTKLPEYDQAVRALQAFNHDDDTPE